jgi:hypothetical protein
LKGRFQKGNESHFAFICFLSFASISLKFALRLRYAWPTKGISGAMIAKARTVK